MDICSADHEIPHLLWNLKVYYPVHISLLWIPRIQCLEMRVKLNFYIKNFYLLHHYFSGSTTCIS